MKDVSGLRLAEQGPGEPADPDQPGADVRADHRSDLAYEQGVAAEDPPPALHERLRLVRGLDVLDDPGVVAAVVARAQEVDHPLERAARGADALDRRDLSVHREDRLDLERAAEPCLRRADPPAAAQELERVDREPDLRRVHGRPHARRDGVDVAATSGRGRTGERHHRDRAARAARVDHLDAPLGLAVREVRRRLARGLDGPRDAAGDVHGDDVASLLDQRLVDRQAFPDRRLRGGWRGRRGPQALVERVEVGHVALALVAVARVDVERDLVHAVGLHELPRHVVRRVHDDGDLWHGRNTSLAGLRPTLRAVGITLVTGATGLVGSHVARLLVDRGDRVRVTTRPRSRLGNLAELDVEPVECDVLDRRAVRRAMRGVDRVFHVAGLTNL